jgi:hypothetical protein
VPSLRTEIVKRSDNMKGFVALPRRRVVERTFSWFGRNRRLVPKPWVPSLPSPPFSLLSGGLPGRRSATRQTAGLHRATVKVCKPDCEETIAGTHGNGEVAPIPDLPGPDLERRRSNPKLPFEFAPQWLIVTHTTHSAALNSGPSPMHEAPRRHGPMPSSLALVFLSRHAVFRLNRRLGDHFPIGWMFLKRFVFSVAEAVGFRLRRL